jgi:hypothetical protein
MEDDFVPPRLRAHFVSKGRRRGRRGRRGRTERKMRRHPPPQNVGREEVIGGERAVRSDGGGDVCGGSLAWSKHNPSGTSDSRQ